MSRRPRAVGPSTGSIPTPSTPSPSVVLRCNQPSRPPFRPFAGRRREWPVLDKATARAKAEELGAADSVRDPGGQFGSPVRGHRSSRSYRCPAPAWPIIVARALRSLIACPRSQKYAADCRSRGWSPWPSTPACGTRVPHRLPVPRASSLCAEDVIVVGGVFHRLAVLPQWRTAATVSGQEDSGEFTPVFGRGKRSQAAFKLRWRRVSLCESLLPRPQLIPRRIIAELWVGLGQHPADVSAPHRLRRPLLELTADRLGLGTLEDRAVAKRPRVMAASPLAWTRPIENDLRLADVALESHQAGVGLLKIRLQFLEVSRPEVLHNGRIAQYPDQALAIRFVLFPCPLFQGEVFHIKPAGGKEEADHLAHGEHVAIGQGAAGLMPGLQVLGSAR